MSTSKPHSELRAFIEERDPTSIGLYLVEFDRLVEQLEVSQLGVQSWADLANWMWTIICNVSEGDWTKQSEVWQDAAADCREQYHALLAANPAATPSEEPIPASEPKA